MQEIVDFFICDPPEDQYLKADNLTESCLFDDLDENKEDDDNEGDDSLDDIEDFGDLCLCRMNCDDEESMVKCGNKFHKMGQWFHF